MTGMSREGRLLEALLVYQPCSCITAAGPLLLPGQGIHGIAPGPQGRLQVGGGLDGRGDCMLQGSLPQVYQLCILVVQGILQLPAPNKHILPLNSLDRCINQRLRDAGLCYNYLAHVYILQV